MELRDALRTSGAARSFTDRPVSDDTLTEILDDARFAPSGGNRQPWHVAVVKDTDLRERLADLMRPVWNEYMAIADTGRTPFTVVEPADYDLVSTRAGNVPNALLDEIATIPVVLVVAADLGRIAMMDQHLDRPTLSGGASIYPFCWSVLLAARARGLGGVITTFLSRAEPLAAGLLGLPDTWALASTIFLGEPTRQATRLSRGPVAGFATLDRFDGVPFGGHPL